MKARSPGARRWAWITGLTLLSVIVGAAVLTARAAIETEIEARAEQKLVETGYGWLDVSATGRNLTLMGAVFTNEDRDRAKAALREIWGVGNVESQLQVAVRAKPYTISLSRSDQKLKLRGNVPTEEARKTIIGLANANFPGLDISTRLKIDPNMAQTERWLTGIGFALSQFKHVSSGRAVLAETELSFQGVAGKPGAYEALKRAFEEQMPANISVTQLRLKPPKADPFTLKISMEAGRVILAGYAPHKAAKVQMTRLANRLFPQSEVVDHTFIANGEPEGWWTAAQLAMKALDYLRSGSVTLGASKVKVEGIAKSMAARRAISALKDAWPSGFNFEAMIQLSNGPPVDGSPRRASHADADTTRL
jgi:OmpA-OmpF porin, OOP family